MSLDQIKDSQRVVGLTALRTVRYAATIQLAENQTYVGGVYDCEGLSLFGYCGRAGTNPATTVVQVDFSPNENFSGTYIYEYISLASGAIDLSKLTPRLIPARYLRIKAQSGSTAGTYTITMFLTLTP